MLAVGTIPTVRLLPQPTREVRRLVHLSSASAARRRAINQAKNVLRRHGQVLPREGDVRRWLIQERVAARPASDRVILLSTCRQLTTLEAEIDGIEGEIARGVADVPAVQVLPTITGTGLSGAAAKRVRQELVRSLCDGQPPGSGSFARNSGMPTRNESTWRTCGHNRTE